MTHHYHKHKMTGTHFYRKWNHIQSRCYNKNNADFRYYGGRGIKCEWESFMDFKKDMYGLYLLHVGKHGEKNTEIDRIDNNRNYSKNNCRFLTRQENTWNTSRNKMYSINGVTQQLPLWCKEYKINIKTVNGRLGRGWHIKDALSLPVQKNSEWSRKYIIYKNKECRLSSLANRKGITYQALSHRLKSMSIEDAMNKPVELNNGKFIPEKFTFKDKTLTLKEWGVILGIKPATLSNRIKRLGWTIPQALGTDILGLKSDSCKKPVVVVT